MQERDFPSLYRSANDVSLRSQWSFLTALSLQLICLIIAAALSSLPQSSLFSTLQLVVLLSALGCSIFLFGARPERRWYAARAVAESIKTMAWRYACRAEPFQTSDADARTLFLQRIKTVLDQNKEVVKELTKFLGEAQITPLMDQIRTSTTEERTKIYVKDRIEDQLSWYAKKAEENQVRSSAFFWALVGTNFVAVVFAVTKVAGITLSFWPVDVLVAFATSFLSWMQAKKFAELASAYSLTAREICLLRENSQSKRTEAEFSAYVGDAEAAFSREHTQWIARRDQ